MPHLFSIERKLEARSVKFNKQATLVCQCIKRQPVRRYSVDFAFLNVLGIG
jgi:hypothetical protein